MECQCQLDRTRPLLHLVPAQSTSTRNNRCVLSHLKTLPPLSTEDAHFAFSLCSHRLQTAESIVPNIAFDRGIIAHASAVRPICHFSNNCPKIRCLSTLNYFLRLHLAATRQFFPKLQDRSFLPENFLATWQLLHCIRHKPPLRFQSIAFSAIEDKERVNFLASTPFSRIFDTHYDLLFSTLSEHAHRVYLGFESTMPEVLLVCDIQEAGGFYQFANCEIVAPNRQILSHYADIVPMDKFLPILSADPSQISHIWQHSSYYYLKPRNSVTREIDIALKHYATLLADPCDSDKNECLFQQLYALFKIHAETVIWITNYHHLNKRVTSVRYLQRWTEKQFSQLGRRFLGKLYHSRHGITEVSLIQSWLDRFSKLTEIA